MGISNAKLIAGGIGLIAALVFVAIALGWRAERNRLAEWQDVVVAETRSAADNPKLGKGHVASQIRLLGLAIDDLKGSIERQNAAVTAAGAATARQQAASASASRAAQERAGRAEATAGRLIASARSGEAQARPCEPSRILKESWR